MTDNNAESSAQTTDGAMAAAAIVWPEGYWPTGKWNQAFVRKHAKAIYDRFVAPFVGDGGMENESVWERGSAAWNAIEATHAKFLEKNGRKLDGAAKWLTKKNGLRDIYM